MRLVGSTCLPQSCERPFDLDAKQDINFIRLFKSANNVVLPFVF